VHPGCDLGRPRLMAARISRTGLYVVELNWSFPGVGEAQPSMMMRICSRLEIQGTQTFGRDQRGGTVSLSAIRTRSIRDFACIFRMIWLRWTFTVISLNSS
jgi:hypothetical protein